MGTVSFFCKASGNPIPQFYWKQAGKRISKRNGTRIIKVPFGSVLRIQRVKFSRDSSIVECVAHNGIQHPAVKTARLDVYKPSEQREL